MEVDGVQRVLCLSSSLPPYLIEKLCFCATCMEVEVDGVQRVLWLSSSLPPI